jgi:hypothetical protein
MRNLNETAVLNYYLELVDKGEISFLKDREQYRDAVKEAVVALRDADGQQDKCGKAYVEAVV